MTVTRFALPWLAALLLAGCASAPVEDAVYPVLREPSAQEDAARELAAGEVAQAPDKVRQTPKPGFRSGPATEQREDIASRLVGEPVSASFRDMPLPEFINEIFGRTLGFNFVTDPALASSQDLVTLSLTDPVPPSALYRTARTVLAEYGVGIVESDDLLRFRRDDDAAQDTPLMVTGSALPDVPASSRPVFYMVTVDVVANVEVSGWLKTLFKGTDLQILDGSGRNTVVLQGPVGLVREAAEIAEVLDQPLLRGKHSRSFTPTYIEVEALARDLIAILATEGYAVSDRPPFASTIILPLTSQERIIVFANSSETLDHIFEWAYDLDAREESQVSEGFFSYQAQNVTADHIARLVGLLKGGDAGGAGAAGETTRRDDEGDAGNGRDREGGARRSSDSGSRAYLDGKIVVDNNRNVLFFNGSGQEWRDLLQLIEEVDKPVPMVLIDVLLAEITLIDEEDAGVEWLFRGDGIAGTNLRASTRGGLELGASGLSLTFDSAGETRAVINAFYKNERAVIRSSPKLLVKSGEEAFIEVGNEIPVITSNSQSVETPGAPVIQNIQYRRTGVLLSINPIVQASGMVDLLISQELSEQVVSGGGGSGSPTILNRKVETALSLLDGGSVLLGGLISSTKSEEQQGIPGLGKLPLFGRLFRTDAGTDNRTELLMLVSVYVIDEHSDAVELTEALKQRLNAPVE